MTSQYTSLEFTGPRKSLFYFIVVLSALALFCAAVAIAADYLFERHLTQGNVVLELSTSSGTIAESLFGAGGLGSCDQGLRGVVAAVRLRVGVRVPELERIHER